MTSAAYMGRDRRDAVSITNRGLNYGDGVFETMRVHRGAYTGSMGWLNRDGDMDLNILIRSGEVEGHELRFRTGAGIVIDSDPQRELDETRAKARGMLRALGSE